jgi:pimeloyl-ACP methyl ester carboxylesterase
VLVHGAWQGAWCWDRLVPILERAGHRPAAIDLQGCGARAPMTPGVELADHVADVVTAADAVDDERFVLVVHSYSGMVAAGVAELIRPRLSAVVLVDAFYPEHGESALDAMPPPFRDRFRARAAEVGDGWRLPADESLLDVWGLHDPVDRRWVAANLTDWSLRCFESPVAAPSRALRSIPRWYVSGVGDHPAGAAFEAIGRVAEADGCSLVTVACGHDVQVERPEDLGSVIDVAATSVGG